MKNLIDYIKEGYVTRYKVTDIDIDKFKEIAEKIGNDRDGLGAAVAQVKDDLVSTILGKMFNEQPWNVKLQSKDWSDEIPKGPIYDVEIEKILHDNFNFFTTKNLTYLAPKKVSKASVKRWLADDFVGTMENPNDVRGTMED